MEELLFEYDYCIEEIIDFAKTNFTEQSKSSEKHLFNLFRTNCTYYSDFNPKESETEPSTHITDKSEKSQILLALEIDNEEGQFFINAKIPIKPRADRDSLRLIKNHRKKTILIRHCKKSLLYICEIQSLGISDSGLEMILILVPQTIIPNNLLIPVHQSIMYKSLNGLEVIECRDFDYLKVRDEIQKSDYFSRVSSLLPSCRISSADFSSKMQVNTSLMKQKLLQCIRKYLPLLPKSLHLDKTSLQDLVSQMKIALFSKKDSLTTSINSANIQNLIENIEKLEGEYLKCCKCGQKLVQYSNLISLDKFNLQCYGYDMLKHFVELEPMVAFRYRQSDKKDYGFTENDSEFLDILYYENFSHLKCNSCHCSVGRLFKPKISYFGKEECYMLIGNISSIFF